MKNTKKIAYENLLPLTNKARAKIRLLVDKGLTSAMIQKRYKKYTRRQIGAVKTWMKRGKY